MTEVWILRASQTWILSWTESPGIPLQLPFIRLRTALRVTFMDVFAPQSWGLDGQCILLRLQWKQVLGLCTFSVPHLLRRHQSNLDAKAAKWLLRRQVAQGKVALQAYLRLLSVTPALLQGAGRVTVDPACTDHASLHSWEAHTRRPKYPPFPKRCHSTFN